jgi:zinc transporter 1/2/3
MRIASVPAFSLLQHLYMYATCIAPQPSPAALMFLQLLPTAFSSLTDPCLPAFWNKGYPAMAGLIAMVSVLFVVSIEMFFSTMNGGSTGGCHGGPGGGYETLTPTTSIFGHRRGASAASIAGLMGGSGGVGSTPNGVRPAARARRSGSIGRQLQRIELNADGLDYAETFSNTEGSSLSAAHSKSDDEEDDMDSDAGEDTELRALNTRKRSNSETRTRRQHFGGRLTEEQQQKKNLLQVMLLEAGILFHSVFIGTCRYVYFTLTRLANVAAGMALSVAVGSNFIVLLIAITFHRIVPSPLPACQI